jgi:hypothetical protein
MVPGYLQQVGVLEQLSCAAKMAALSASACPAASPERLGLGVLLQGALELAALVDGTPPVSATAMSSWRSWNTLPTARRAMPRRR